MYYAFPLLAFGALLDDHRNPNMEFSFPTEQSSPMVPLLFVVAPFSSEVHFPRVPKLPWARIRADDNGVTRKALRSAYFPFYVRLHQSSAAVVEHESGTSN